jgi:hypothetical protein
VAARPEVRTAVGRGVAHGAAAAIVVAAAAAVFEAVTRADRFFAEQDSQVIGTLVAAFLCGGCAYAGLRLLERRVADPFGWLALVGGPVAFAAFTLGIWWLDGWHDHTETLGKILGTAAVVLLSALALATNRLLGAPVREAWIAFLVVLACTLVVDVVAFAAIWSVHPTGGDTGTSLGRAGGRVAFVAGIVGVAAWLLTPLLHRLAFPRRAPTR